MKLCKIGLAACGVALGLYSAYGAFRFNVGISGDYAFALVLVALTVGCWFLPPVAVHFWSEGKKRLVLVVVFGWAAMMSIVLANAMGFTAGNRRKVASGHEQEIQVHDRAQRAFDDANAGLKQVTGNTLWGETAACAIRATKAQKSFCAQADRYKASKEAADDELRTLKKPATSDAQADIFSALTGMKVETVQTGLSAANTLVLEFGSNFLLLLAGIVPWRQDRPVEPIASPIEDIEAQLRATIEAERIAKAEAAKAEAKREQSRQYRLRRKVQLEAANKKPKRKRRKKKPPSTKSPALRLVK
jgi:hypothetical protein